MGKGKKGGKGGAKVGNGKQKRGSRFLKTPIQLYTIVLYQCNFNILYSCCCYWMYDITHVLQLSQHPRGKSKLNVIKRRLSLTLHIYKVYLLLQHTVCPRNIIQLVSSDTALDRLHIRCGMNSMFEVYWKYGHFWFFQSKTWNSLNFFLLNIQL